MMNYKSKSGNYTKNTECVMYNAYAMSKSDMHYRDQQNYLAFGVAWKLLRRVVLGLHERSWALFDYLKFSMRTY